MRLGRGTNFGPPGPANPLFRGSPTWLGRGRGGSGEIGRPIGRAEAILLRAKLFSPVGVTEIDLNAHGANLGKERLPIAPSLDLRH